MDLPLANARANIPPVEVPQIQSKHCDVGTPHTFYLNENPNCQMQRFSNAKSISTFSIDNNILVNTRPFTPPPSRLNNRPEEIAGSAAPSLETTDPLRLTEP